MKKSLLATVAAAALIAGPALAQKQEAPGSDVKGAAPPPAAVQKAPAEKIAPPSEAVSPRSGKDSGTTGQSAPSPSRDAAPDADRSRTNGQPAPPAGDKAGSSPRSGAQPGTTGQGSTAAQPSGAAVTLNTEQKQRIRTTVLRAGNAPRVTNVNFSINVGTVVPRTVRVVAVPPTLVEIHPAWRGFLYFVHGDQIVIVEPGTLRIVAVIEV